MFHVEHFPIRLQFPKCSTWNRALCQPSNSGPQLRLLSTIRSEKFNDPLLKPTDVPATPASFAPRRPAHTHRHIIQRADAPAATTLVSGCSSSYNTTTPPADSQPAPAGPMTAASLSVSATPEDSIGPAFTGLPYEKSPISEYPFRTTASNTHLIGLFKRIQPSVLRKGETPSTRNAWTASAGGNTPTQVPQPTGLPSPPFERPPFDGSLANQPGPLRNRRNHPRTGCSRDRLRPPEVPFPGSRPRGLQ